MKKWLVVLCVILPLSFLIWGTYNTFNTANQLAVEENNLKLDVQYSYLIDDEQQYHQSNILSAIDQFIDAPLNQAKVNFGEFTYWYRLNLRNVTRNDQEYVLLLDNPMIDEIKVFEGTKQANLVTVLGDGYLDIGASLLAFPNTPITIKSGQTVQLIIKSSTAGAASLPLVLFTAENFNDYKESVYLLWGAFIGVIFLMAFYNLILYIGVNDNLYLLYIGYVVVFLLELGVVHGYNAYVFSPAVFEFLNKNIITLNYLIGYFTLLFALNFFRLKKSQHKNLYVITKSYAYLMLLGGLVSFFVVEYKAAQVYFPMLSVMYVIAIWLLIDRWVNNVRWTKYYFISWLPLFIGGTIGPMLVTGNIEHSFWTRHALLLGVMFEMTFISMALADRLRVTEKERLFDATHDPVFKFCNSVLLHEKAKNLIHDVQTANFSYLIIEIRKYESVIPYLSGNSHQSMLRNLAQDIEDQFQDKLSLLTLDTEVELGKTAMIREGVFAYLVSSNDKALLRKVISELMQLQPLQYQLEKISVNLSLRVGSSTFTEGSESRDTLNQALMAVEMAKEHNLDFWIYDQASKSEDLKKVRLASELQIAIENSTLQLYHQPQVDLSTGKVIGSEVLLRWIHKEFGFVPPDQFVAIAEGTGLINTLTNWVFETACKQLCLIQKGTDGKHVVSVNLSALDVTHDPMINHFVRTLNRYKLKAENFTLELTETVSATDLNKFAKNLSELKDLGFSIAMDDFGTGYSSLTYVSQHPFDEIKIDRSFVKDLASSEKDETIVSATVNMAKSLGLKVVAEGIEDEDAVNVLKGLHCDIGQGYFYSKPMPIDEFVAWTRQNSFLN